MIERKIGTINNGVVIDHISAGKGVIISKILSLDSFSEFVVIASNLKSKKSELKDLIKIEGKELSKEELNKIALISKDSTINIIREGKVFLKYKVKCPEKINNILVCNNPNCVSNAEKIESKFLSSLNNNEIDIICYYCEKKQNQIILK